MAAGVINNDDDDKNEDDDDLNFVETEQLANWRTSFFPLLQQPLATSEVMASAGDGSSTTINHYHQ